MSAAAGGPPSGGVNSITGLSSATTARINCSLDGPWEPAQVPALVVMSIMYGLVTLFALAGNGLVCYIVLAYPRMRTVTNMFIVNLAVGDILMAVFCIPFSFVSNFITEHWVFGYFMCIAVGYCQAISVSNNRIGHMDGLISNYALTTRQNIKLYWYLLISNLYQKANRLQKTKHFIAINNNGNN